MTYVQFVEADLQPGKSCKATKFAKQNARNWLAIAGAVMPYAGTVVPTGWLACDGASYLRADYPDLFAALGGASSPWGLPDGTHFNVPDLRGRAIVGAGTGSGLTARALAATGGVETHALSTMELASHYHMQNRNSGAPTSASALKQNTSSTPGDWQNTATKGSGTAHNNMPPYRALPWLIKT